MITMMARRVAVLLALLATDAVRFLKSYLVVSHPPQDYLVTQRVADGRRARRRAFGAGGRRT